MRNSVKMIAVGGLVAASLLAATSAFADDVVQTVTAGTRTASVSAVTLGAVAASHGAANSAGTMTLHTDDSTGSGAGWNVTQEISNFHSTVAGSTDIPATGFTVTPGTLASTAGAGTAGVTPTAGPVALNTPVSVLSAAAGSGMGSYDLPTTLALSVPGNTYAGSYTATLTTTIVAGP